jgi:O-antigen/teichoic acid export membrane protein
LTIDVQPIASTEPVALSGAQLVRPSRFAVLARDVVTMGVGTALGAVFNTLLVFLIPRLVSVKDFGYWRLFMLYGGYAGLLQVGFLDGALLRWAGRPWADFHGELRPSLKFLVWQLVGFTGATGAVISWTMHAQARFIGLAVLAYAILFNINALMQYSLQSARQFKPVAIATAAPAGLFVLLTFAWNLRQVPDFRVLIELYCVAWAGALVYLWNRVKPLQKTQPSGSAWSLGKSFVLLGWPIVLANIGFGLVQSADRLVVSWVLPLQQFAQYSLASSAMFVPVTAIAAIYRVFFSHAAALQHEGRARIYGHASRFLLLAWSALLPYYFVLEVLVRHMLPKYSGALPVAGILLFSIFFLAEIQILHTSFAYIHGKQREFLFLTMGACALTFSIGLGMAFLLGSLVAMAVGQLVALAVWWLVNDWTLRATTGQSWAGRITLLAIFAWSVISYEIAMKSTMNVGARILFYYALAGAALILVCRSEIKILWQLISRAGATSLSDEGAVT